MGVFRVLITLIIVLLSGRLSGESLTLIMLDTIRVDQLGVDPLRWRDDTEGAFLQEPEPAFGFLDKGKLLFFGKGGWAYDLESRKLEKRFPDTLYWPILSADGDRLFGTLKEHAESPWDGRFVCIEAATGNEIPVKWKRGAYPKYSAIHPNNRILTWVDPDDRTGAFYDALHFTDLSTGQTWKAGHRWYDNLAEVYSFTGDGQYLVIQGESTGGRRLMEIQNLQMLPEDAGEGYLYNRDASWVAGGYEGGSTFVWNRIRKAYVWEHRPVWDPEKVNHVWKDKPFGIPSAFSPNNAYLLCEGVIVDAATGQAAFNGLQGKHGKFSPDGRSLVTVDDKAFYIYTLPKDSAPIFGVFQEPKPWSLPKAKSKGRKR